MMLIPTSTDAPLYHYPITTIGLIVTNVVVYGVCVAVSGDLMVLSGYGNPNITWSGTRPELVAQWCLHYGAIQPLRWLTSIFIHAGPFHLLGNMIFLWSFGLIVEGKLGWTKMLAVYLGIGVSQSAIEQVLFFQDSGLISCGASAAIYGLLALACLWAPVNRFQVSFIIFLFIYIYRYSFEILIAFFGLFYLAIELMFIPLTGLSPSSALLHVMGAAIGAGVGVWMLKTGRVDCEGYDAISVLTGRQGKPQLSEAQQEKQRKEREQQVEKKRAMIDQGQQKIAQYIKQGNLDFAILRFQTLKKMFPVAQWRQDNLLNLVCGLHQKKRWNDSIPWMKQYIHQFPADALRMQLKLAQIYLLHANRPSQAANILKSLEAQDLKPEIEKIRRDLLQQAQQMLASGVVDIPDD